MSNRSVRSIQIQLDDNDRPDRAHTIGDAVKGKVFLQLSSKVAINVSITFKGIAQSEIRHFTGNGPRHCTGKAILFQSHRRLRARNEPIGPGTFSWPFHYVFPDGALPHGAERSYKPFSVFVSSSGHALPQSWKSHRWEEEGVSYYIIVTVETPSVLGISKELKMPIFFVPSRASEDPYPNALDTSKEITFRSREFDPALAGRKYSLKEQALNILFAPNDYIPFSLYKINVSVPRVVILGEELPITLKVEPDLVKSTATKVPELYLSNFRAELKKRVDMRAPRLVLSKEQGYHLNDWSEVFPLANQTCMIPMSQPIILRQLIKEVLVPSFQTYNIVLSYDTRIKFVFTCLDKTSEVEFTVPLTILSKIYRLPESGGDIAVRDEEAGDDDCPPPYAEEAPPYEEHDGGLVRAEEASSEEVQGTSAKPGES